MPRFVAAMIASVTGLSVCAPASAADETLEFWLNPSVSLDLDRDTTLELETAQRFRSAEDGRSDTHFARLWLKQGLAEDVELGGAIERRLNNRGNAETRLIQQLSTRHGILRSRIRIEERFVDGAGRMGLRLQPRIGVTLPLDRAGRWSIYSNAEISFTLKSTRRGGADGVTAMRTQAGASYAASDNLAFSLAYVRQQEFLDFAPDRVGHAPLLGIAFSF